MITFVVCLFDGNQAELRMKHKYANLYTPEWADKLYRGVARNIKEPFDFVCLVDKEYEFQEPVRAVPFEGPVVKQSTLPLLEAYRPDLATGRRITFGLDTIITGDLTPLTELTTHFAACRRSRRRKGQLQNFVTTCSHEGATRMWDTWVNEHKAICDHFGYWKMNEEQVIRWAYHKRKPRAEDIGKLVPGLIMDWNGMRRSRAFVGDARIVYFHGRPKPHLVTHPRKDEILQHWV